MTDTASIVRVSGVCVECGLIDDVSVLTLCAECSQAAHSNGLCTGECPWCGALICSLCIDTSRSGGWHLCSPDPELVLVRSPEWS